MARRLTGVEERLTRVEEGLTGVEAQLKKLPDVLAEKLAGMNVAAVEGIVEGRSGAGRL